MSTTETIKQTSSHRRKNRTSSALPVLSETERLRERVVPGIVLLIALLTFIPVLGHDFTNWDDPGNVVQNTLVMSPTLTGIIEAWTKPLNSMYSPLVFMSYIVDAAIGQGKPRPFHFTNLLLHLAATLFVYLVLRHLLKDRLPLVAGIGALVFAIHPLQAEPVAWVTGRKDVLAGALGLCAIWLHLCAGDDEHPRRTSMRVLAAIAYGLSLLAKASGIALPIAVLAIQVLVEKRPLRISALRLLPWVVIAVIVSMVAMAAQPLPEWIRNAVPLERRPLLAGHALSFYFMKTLWPSNLAPVYSVTAIEAAANPINAVYLVAVLLIAACMAWLRGKTAAALCMFLAPLLPVMGFIPFLYQEISLTADRYAYVSLLGFGMAISWTIERAWSSDRWRMISLVGCTLMILLYVALTNRQAMLWKDSKTLWTYAVGKSPGVPEAHTNLAFVHYHESNDSEAEKQLQLAVKGDPDFSMGWTMLGLLKMENHGPDAALPALKEAVRSIESRGYKDRRLAEAYNNLGVALIRKQEFASAEEQFRKAIAVAPLADAHGNLASVLQSQERPDEARASYEEALRLGAKPTADDENTSHPSTPHSH